MHPLAQANAIHSDLCERTLTLNLILVAPGDVIMRSCEVLGRGFRNRLSFQEKKRLEDVIVGSLVRAIQTSLQTIPSGAHVLSQPNFLIELPGLSLYGMHLMVMEAKDGVRNAILRFKEFIGATNKAFLPDVGYEESMASHSEKLAMNVLEDICLPILNLCQSFSEDCGGNGHGVPSRITDRAREFQFQTELLKRFIFNAHIGHADARDDYLGAAPALKPLRLQG